MTLKLLEGFAGIGAVAFALEELGIDYSSDIIEWNIYSTIAYAAVHHNDEYLKNKRKNETLTSKELNQYLSDNYSKEDGTPLFSATGKEPLCKYRLTHNVALNLVAAVQTVNNSVDISTVSIKDKEQYDLFWHSSPCQNFSLAGNNKGGDEGSGTSSSLLYESIRLIKENTPKIVIWENVKGALAKKHIHNVEKYKDELSKLGYKHSTEVISGDDVGWVQPRPRVFIYSYLEEENEINLIDILKHQYNKVKLEKVIDFSKDSIKIPFETSSVVVRNSKYARESFLKKGYDLETDNYVYDSGLSPSRPSRAYVGKTPTLLTSKRIAKYSAETKTETLLTAREYWSLMSFPADKYDLVNGEINDVHLYKICGNSVLVLVIKEILKLNKMLDKF